MSEFSNPLAAKRAPQAVESLYEDVAEDAGQQLSYMNVTLNSGRGNFDINFWTISHVFLSSSPPPPPHSV